MVDSPATRNCAWLTLPMNRFRYVARGVSFVVALLICLGIFLLPLPTSVSEGPAALTMANLPRADQETNGDGNPLEGAYFLAPAEEAEDADKHPLNAELLTMLLLTVCFGVSVGWLLRNSQRQGGLCSLAVVCPSFATSCENLPFLGVFRL
jgi:hypothetical protein